MEALVRCRANFLRKSLPVTILSFQPVQPVTHLLSPAFHASHFPHACLRQSAFVLHSSTAITAMRLKAILAAILRRQAAEAQHERQQQGPPLQQQQPPAQQPDEVAAHSPLPPPPQYR